MSMVKADTDLLVVLPHRHLTNVNGIVYIPLLRNQLCPQLEHKYSHTWIWHTATAMPVRRYGPGQVRHTPANDVPLGALATWTKLRDSACLRPYRPYRTSDGP